MNFIDEEKPGFFRRITNFSENWFEQLELLSVLCLSHTDSVIGGMFTDDLQPIPNKGALYLAPNGLLVDQRSYIPPLDLLSSQNAYATETLVREVIVVLQKSH